MQLDLQKRKCLFMINPLFFNVFVLIVLADVLYMYMYMSTCIMSIQYYDKTMSR